MTDAGMFPIDNEDLDRGHASLFDDALFSIAREPTAFLRDRYQEPPFTILDRRGGAWQERDRKWKALGIQSEVGRADGLAYNIGMSYSHATPAPPGEEHTKTSVFSLRYRASSPSIWALTANWS